MLDRDKTIFTDEGRWESFSLLSHLNRSRSGVLKITTLSSEGTLSRWVLLFNTQPKIMFLEVFDSRILFYFCKFMRREKRQTRHQ